MSALQESAKAVLTDMHNGIAEPAAAAPVPGGFLQIIIAIITQLLGSGGLGFCKPTPARAHKLITNPGPLQQRILRRTVRQNVSSYPLQVATEESILRVSGGFTPEQSAALYQEVNG